MANERGAHHLDDHFSASMLSRLVLWFRGEGRELWIVLLYALGTGLFALAVPIAVQSLVNSVAFGSILQPVVVLTLLVFTVLILSAFIKALQFYITEMMQRRVFVRVSIELARRLPFVDYDTFKRRLGVDYVNRFLEIAVVQKMTANLLLDGLSGVLQIVIGLVLLAFYHPMLLAFALVLVISVAILFALTGRGAIRSSVEESNAKYEVLSWLETLTSAPISFRSTQGNRYALERADAATERYLRERSHYFRIVFRQKIATLALQAFASALLLGLGGWLVIRNQLTLGQLVAAELIVTMVLESLAKITKQLENYYDLAAALIKLDSLVELPVENLRGEYFGIEEKPLSLAFRNLVPRRPRFGADHGAINLTIPAGAKVGIYGTNGSGKSSLADVIFRLREPLSGSVELDGYNVHDIHPQELRSGVMILRGVELFEGTIEDNLKLGRTVSLADVRGALVELGLDDELRALPEGIKTYLPGTVGPLSKGQAIRLMIARAIIQRPRLLIIDETLDAIDDSNMEIVLRTLLRPEAPWTLIVMTHERALLQRFPQAFILERGAIRAEGEHHVS